MPRSALQAPAAIDHIPFIRQERGELSDLKDKSRCIAGLLKADARLAYPRMHVHGLEFGTGALLQPGEDHSRFGEPTAGACTVWMCRRVSF